MKSKKVIENVKELEKKLQGKNFEEGEKLIVAFAEKGGITFEEDEHIENGIADLDFHLKIDSMNTITITYTTTAEKTEDESDIDFENGKWSVLE
jgi:hypothetical protein